MYTYNMKLRAFIICGPDRNSLVHTLYVHISMYITQACTRIYSNVNIHMKTNFKYFQYTVHNTIVHMYVYTADTEGGESAILRTTKTTLEELTEKNCDIRLRKMEFSFCTITAIYYQKTNTK